MLPDQAKGPSEAERRPKAALEATRPHPHHRGVEATLARAAASPRSVPIGYQNVSKTVKSPKRPSLRSRSRAHNRPLGTAGGFLRRQKSQVRILPGALAKAPLSRGFLIPPPCSVTRGHPVCGRYCVVMPVQEPGVL